MAQTPIFPLPQIPTGEQAPTDNSQSLDLRTLLQQAQQGTQTPTTLQDISAQYGNQNPIQGTTSSVQQDLYNQVSLAGILNSIANPPQQSQQSINPNTQNSNGVSLAQKLLAMRNAMQQGQPDFKNFDPMTDPSYRQTVLKNRARSLGLDLSNPNVFGGKESENIADHPGIYIDPNNIQEAAKQYAALPLLAPYNIMARVTQKDGTVRDIPTGEIRRKMSDTLNENDPSIKNTGMADEFNAAGNSFAAAIRDALGIGGNILHNAGLVDSSTLQHNADQAMLDRLDASRQGKIGSAIGTLGAAAPLAVAGAAAAPELATSGAGAALLGTGLESALGLGLPAFGEASNTALARGASRQQALKDAIVSGAANTALGIAMGGAGSKAYKSVLDAVPERVKNVLGNIVKGDSGTLRNRLNNTAGRIFTPNMREAILSGAIGGVGGAAAQEAEHQVDPINMEGPDVESTLANALFGAGLGYVGARRGNRGLDTTPPRSSSGDNIPPSDNTPQSPASTPTLNTGSANLKDIIGGVDREGDTTSSETQNDNPNTYTSMEDIFRDYQNGNAEPESNLNRVNWNVPTDNSGGESNRSYNSLADIFRDYGSNENAPGDVNIESGQYGNKHPVQYQLDRILGYGQEGSTREASAENESTLAREEALRQENENYLLGPEDENGEIDLEQRRKNLEARDAIASSHDDVDIIAGKMTPEEAANTSSQLDQINTGLFNNIDSMPVAEKEEALHQISVNNRMINAIHKKASLLDEKIKEGDKTPAQGSFDFLIHEPENSGRVTDIEEGSNGNTPPNTHITEGMMRRLSNLKEKTKPNNFLDVSRIKNPAALAKRASEVVGHYGAAVDNVRNELRNNGISVAELPEHRPFFKVSDADLDQLERAKNSDVRNVASIEKAYRDVQSIKSPTTKNFMRQVLSNLREFSDNDLNEVANRKSEVADESNDPFSRVLQAAAEKEQYDRIKSDEQGKPKNRPDDIEYEECL